MLRETLGLLAYQARFYKRQAQHDFRNVYSKAIRDLQRFGFGQLQGKRILDLGCGQRFPFALLSAAEGAYVTALDLDYVEPSFLLKYGLKIARHNGLRRAVKSVVRRLLFDRGYYKTLEQAYGKPLSPYRGQISFVVADPALWIVSFT